MTKEYRIVLLNIVICSIFFAVGLFIANRAHAQASAPGLPFQLYGKVTTESGLPVSNAAVEAEIKGVLVAKSVTNTSGDYGLAPNLLIISDPKGDYDGSTVTLMVGGVPVQQIAIFGPGVLEELDLTTSKPAVAAIIIRSTNAQVHSDSTTNSFQAASSSGESRSSQVSSTPEEVSYTTPVFHLKKHMLAGANQKEQESSLKHRHSKVLGTISLILIIIILSWVYIQNYLHKRKQDF